MPFDGKDLGYLEPPPPMGSAAGSQGKLRWMHGLRLCLFAAGAVGRKQYTLPRGVPENSEAAAAQLLRAARSMIDREEMWIQGRYNARGGRHCAVGALRAVGRFYDSEALRVAHALLHNVAHSRGFDSVEKMNDACSHGQVIGAFGFAIASAEALASSRMAA